MNVKRFFRLAAMLAALAMAVAACGGGSSGEPLSVTLHAKDIAFDRAAINAKPNQTVTVTLVNDGTLDHGFVVDGLLEQQLAPAGKTVTFSFKTGAAGAFQFYCPIAGHKEAGMIGVLTVAP